MQHTTSIIENKRVETRSLKKAMAAWLHLALIPDIHRFTTVKKLCMRYNLNAKHSTAIICFLICDVQTSGPHSTANQTRVYINLLHVLKYPWKKNVERYTRVAQGGCYYVVYLHTGLTWVDEDGFWMEAAEGCNYGPSFITTPKVTTRRKTFKYGQYSLFRPESTIHIK